VCSCSSHPFSRCLHHPFLHLQSTAMSCNKLNDCRGGSSSEVIGLGQLIACHQRDRAPRCTPQRDSGGSRRVLVKPCALPFRCVDGIHPQVGFTCFTSTRSFLANFPTSRSSIPVGTYESRSVIHARGPGAAGNQAVTCLACPINTFSTSILYEDIFVSTCIACPPGSASPPMSGNNAGSNAVCKACPDGFYSLGFGDSCSLCLTSVPASIYLVVLVPKNLLRPLLNSSTQMRLSSI